MFYDELIEWSVIDTALNNSKLLNEIMVLKSEDIYFEHNRHIFDAIKRIYERNEPVGIVTVKDELKRMGRVEIFDKILDKLSGNPLYSHTLKPALKVLKEHSHRRKLYNLMLENMQNLKDYKVNSTSVISNLNSGINCINKDNTKKYNSFGDEGLDLDRFVKEGEYIKSGLSGLDEKIIGFFKTNLTLLAARPKEGKSTLALNIARKATQSGKVLFFSLEMSNKEIEERLIVSESRLQLQNILKGELTLNDIKILEEKQKVLKKDLSDKLMIYTRMYYLDEIMNECRRQCSNNDVSIIIFDYLQLIRIAGMRERRMEVEEVSRSLKILAGELNLPVIALSQLSRIKPDEEPQIYHLRESGALEQDSNMIIFIHKDSDTEQYYIIVAANRQGKIGKIKVNYDKKHFLFMD